MSFIGSPGYDCAKFIAAESYEELDKVAERNPEVKKAVVKYRELTAEERTRDMYERREKARRDMVSQQKWAIKQKQLEIAKNLFARNMTIEDIIEITGLSQDEVESINIIE